MLLSLIAIFISSLLGSVHCLGMCGALAAAVHNTNKSSLISYQLGRLITYSLLGAVAGAFGSIITKFSPTLIIFFALLLIVYGVLGILGYSKKILPGFFTKSLSTLIAKGKGRGGFIVGLLTGLLPCGWLYSYVGIAAIQASALTGSLILASFWLGTVPWLAGPAFALKKLASPKVAATIVYIMVIFSGGMILSQKAYSYFHSETASTASCH